MFNAYSPHLRAHLVSNRQSAIIASPQRGEQLLKYKKAKDSSLQIKKLKQSVQNELKKMLFKEEGVKKTYKQRKQQLKQMKVRQIKYLQNLQQKQHLEQMKFKNHQSLKSSTQLFRNINREKLQSAKLKSLNQKRKVAQSTKGKLKELKDSRILSESRLLQQKKVNFCIYFQSRFSQIQSQKVKARRENLQFFQTRYSRIIKNCSKQQLKLELEDTLNKRDISKIQSRLLGIRRNSENKHQLILQLQQDIRQVNKETLNISKSRLNIYSQRVDMIQNQQQSLPVLKPQSLLRLQQIRKSSSLPSIDRRHLNDKIRSAKQSMQTSGGTNETRDKK